MILNENRGDRRDTDAEFIHDLNNLLALISHNSDSELIHSNLSREDMRRHLSQIHAASRTTIDLIASYQSLTDPVHSFDLRDLISRTAKAVSDYIPHRVLVTVPGQPILTYDDPEPLTRVILNLSDNARNAAGKAGQIVLSLALASTEPVEEVEMNIGYQPDQPFAIVTVTDTGHGIPQAMMAQIWDRGFTTKRRANSGLGLALVRDLIEREGAGLTVETCVGSGTTFRVFWPLRTAW